MLSPTRDEVFRLDALTGKVLGRRSAADAAPKNVPRTEWTRRFSLALDAMRGLALTLTIQPRTTPIHRDPWPDLRRELARLLDR